MSMGIVDPDMVVRQVSPGQTWCLIHSLVSVWSSSLYDMLFALHWHQQQLSLGYHTDSYLYIWETGKDVDMLATDTLNRGNGMVGPHLCLGCSPGPSVVLYICAVSLLISFYFTLFSNGFCILVHDYLYALLVLLVAVLVTTITSLYDLTI